MSTLRVPSTLAVGTYDFEVTAHNRAGSSPPQNFTLTVNGRPPVITSGVAFTAAEGIGGNFPLTATGTPPITFTVPGAPSGVSIVGNNLVVDATAAAGTYDFLLVATNVAASTTRSFRLTVTPKPTWAISHPTQLTWGPARVGYSQGTTNSNMGWQQVNVWNIGNQPTGVINAALSGDVGAFNWNSGQVGQLASIGAGGNRHYNWIVPRTGLAIGTYTATVTFFNGNIAAQTLTLSFTVTA